MPPVLNKSPTLFCLGIKDPNTGNVLRFFQQRKGLKTYFIVSFHAHRQKSECRRSQQQACLLDTPSRPFAKQPRRNHWGVRGHRAVVEEVPCQSSPSPLQMSRQRCQSGELCPKEPGALLSACTSNNPALDGQSVPGGFERLKMNSILAIFFQA